ncbi:serine/threonine protein kinase [Lolliginicoccus suaedae]|uniref:serine/threonine protein kinase n=1 Tax=Lolliginicoccus suaedae TaxID=2605429 RepID=UPI0011EDEC8D|nr:serine/threonine protein kinase [Lolliginicoccus suaedae]
MSPSWDDSPYPDPESFLAPLVEPAAGERSPRRAPVIAASLLAVLAAGIVVLALWQPAPPAEEPAQRSGVELAVSVPMTRPSCGSSDAIGIVVLGNAVTPGQYDEEVQRLLDENPGAHYLRTDRACPSLRQSVDGHPIYAVFQFAGTTKEAMCQAVRNAGDGAYGRWLSTTHDPNELVTC